MTTQELKDGQRLLGKIERMESLLSRAKAANAVAIGFVPSMDCEIVTNSGVFRNCLIQSDIDGAELTNTALQCAKSIIVIELTRILDGLKAEFAALGTVREPAEVFVLVSLLGGDYQIHPIKEFEASGRQDTVVYTGSQEDCQAELNRLVPSVPW